MKPNNSIENGGYPFVNDESTTQTDLITNSVLGTIGTVFWSGQIIPQVTDRLWFFSPVTYHPAGTLEDMEELAREVDSRPISPANVRLWATPPIAILALMQRSIG